MTAILVASALAMGADPAYDRDLLRAVADGHRHARDAIVTLHVKAQILSVTPDRADVPRQHLAVEWWQAGPDWRSRESVTQEATPPAKATVPPTWHERLFKGGVAKAVNLTERQGAVGDADWLVTPMSPWKWGLFQIQDRPPVTFADLLTDEAAVRNVAPEGEGAKRLVVVQFAARNGWTTRVWFDPAVNYLARRCVFESGKGRTECEVETFREAKPGVFVPVKCVSRSNVGGKRDLASTVEATAEVNEPIKDDAFTLQFPDKTFVEDKVKGLEYVTGPDGEPTRLRPPRPVPQAKAAPAEAPAGNVAPLQAWPKEVALPRMGGNGKVYEATFLVQRADGQPCAPRVVESPPGVTVRVGSSPKPLVTVAWDHRSHPATSPREARTIRLAADVAGRVEEVTLRVVGVRGE